MVEPNHSTLSLTHTQTQRDPAMAVAPRRRNSRQALPDELIEEIFLRLPLDELSCLLRASLVSKSLSLAVSDPFFRRRLHSTSSTGHPSCSASSTTGTTAASPASYTPPPQPSPSPPRTSAPGRWSSSAAMAAPYSSPTARLLRNSSSGSQSRAPNIAYLCPRRSRTSSQPRPCSAQWTAATTTTAMGGPFRVVFVFAVDDDSDDTIFTLASVYSSETGTWGEVTRINNRATCFSSFTSSVLVGRSLFYFMADGLDTMEYDLATHALALLDSLEPLRADTFSLMLAEDGELGVGEASDPPQLKLWLREASDGTDARWVLRRAIYLDNLALPNAALSARISRRVFFAEGANVIFVTMIAGVFTIELQSERVKKACDHDCWDLVPVVSFYTPVPRGEHHGLPSLNLSEEAGGEEGGVEEEKTVEQAHQLFDKGTNAIKEGDCARAFISHNLKTRLGFYFRTALLVDRGKRTSGLFSAILDEPLFSCVLRSLSLSGF